MSLEPELPLIAEAEADAPSPAPPEPTPMRAAKKAAAKAPRKAPAKKRAPAKKKTAPRSRKQAVAEVGSTMELPSLEAPVPPAAAVDEPAPVASVQAEAPVVVAEPVVVATRPEVVALEATPSPEPIAPEPEMGAPVLEAADEVGEPISEEGVGDDESDYFAHAEGPNGDGEFEVGDEALEETPGAASGERPRKEIPLGPPSDVTGMVELSPKGFGFLRQANRSFYQTNKDTFVPPDMVRAYQLRDGLIIHGEMRRSPRGPQLTAIYTINDVAPEKYRDLPVFEELTAVNPNKRWILETDPKRFTTRIIDMMTPIGRGQRGLIVAPPRTGKTTLLQHIAESVIQNGKDAKLILLLIDERPEEVTELTRALPKAEIMASSNDNDTRTHMRIAEMTIERAKRLVEAGEHVFILLDSITRLARAYNRAMRGKGGLNKGGLSNRALEVPRRLFAAARNTREAGSLTIVATALIDTGTAMDEAIYQEFKGTGNLELVLDKKIAQQYIYPAVDIFKSGTRREELLLPPHQLEKIFVIRRGLSGHKPIEAIERLLSFVQKFPNNAQMLLEIKGTSAYAE